jgi:hypothetical protein
MKMKKVAYLSILMLSLVLISTSCCKDDDPIVPDTLTAQDLVGDWNFVSLAYGNNVYDTDEELSVLNDTKNYVTINLLDVNASSMTLRLYDEYGVDLSGMSFTLTDNILSLDGGALTFEIVNFSTFDGVTLKLKLLTNNSQVPYGGTYTLTHSN